MTGTVTLRHNKVDLALHELRGGDGPVLLLVHGLGERTPDRLPPQYDEWPGAVWGLDLAGHGQSSVPVGGGYFCEALMGDVDHALAHLGPATVAGRGLGAYLTLLIAGARPDLVRGAILLDGPGLAGGGPEPGSPSVLVVVPPASPGGTPDPFALAELTRDIRPPDYAATFVRLASAGSDLDAPLAAVGRNRPPWLAAVVQEPGVLECTLSEALRTYGAL